MKIAQIIISFPQTLSAVGWGGGGGYSLKLMTGMPRSHISYWIRHINSLSPIDPFCNRFSTISHWTCWTTPFLTTFFQIFTFFFQKCCQRCVKICIFAGKLTKILTVWHLFFFFFGHNPLFSEKSLTPRFDLLAEHRPVTSKVECPQAQLIHSLNVLHQKIILNYL